MTQWVPAKDAWEWICRRTSDRTLCTSPIYPWFGM